MKAVISIPDDLFVTAKQLAERLSMSWSELYVSALCEYVAARRYDNTTERLNAIYNQEPSALDPELRHI